jgi:3-oxoacyl-[acyl-carrier protein] reductase
MFDLVLQINLASAIEACLAWMEMKGPNIPGRIVNVASAAGIRGSQDLAYTASKAGLIAVTRSLARAFAPQRTAVFSVAPGIVDTPMAAAMSDDRRQATVSRTIAQREATPSEVAALIVFLLTDQSDYMTGSVVTIDGGLTP